MRLLLSVCVLIGAGCSDPAFFSERWRAFDPYEELFEFAGESYGAPEPADAVHSWDATDPAGCPTVGDATNITGTYPANGSAGEALTVAGTPECNADGSDWYIAFDGISDYFTVAAGTMTDMDQPFTWCTEASFGNPASTSFQVLFDSNTTGTGDRTQVAKIGNAGANANKMQMYAGTTDIADDTVTVADQYYCLCGVVNGASSKLYVDGSETALSVGALGLDSITVGARASTRALKFNGRLRFMKFWDGDVSTDAMAWDCGGVH